MRNDYIYNYFYVLNIFITSVPVTKSEKKMAISAKAILAQTCGPSATFKLSGRGGNAKRSLLFSRCIIWKLFYTMYILNSISNMNEKR